LINLTVERKLRSHIIILGCNQAPLSKDWVVKLTCPCNLCCSYWKCISSVQHNGVQICLHEFLTFTSYLQIYVKQQRKSWLSWQKNEKI
jgi:hypothetical protein